MRSSPLPLLLFLAACGRAHYDLDEVVALVVDESQSVRPEYDATGIA